MNIEAIKARTDAATPGPWVPSYDECGDSWEVLVGNKALARVIRFSTDAEFIAHARKDIPALLAEVERLNKLNDDYSQTILRLEGENGDITAERDAAVEDMKAVIKNSAPYISACAICSKPCGEAQENADFCDKFEWRGRKDGE